VSDPREDLADRLYRALNPEIQQDAGWVPTVDGTGNVACHIAADAATAAGWRPPRKTYPEHEVDMERFPVCTVCDRDVRWNEETEEWEH
jgi:hypothetical protein